MKTILFSIIVLYGFIGFAQIYTFRNGDSVEFEITPEGFKGLTLIVIDSETKKWVMEVYLKHSSGLYYQTLTTSWGGTQDVQEFSYIEPLINQFIDQLKKRHPDVNVNEYNYIIEKIY